MQLTTSKGAAAMTIHVQRRGHQHRDRRAGGETAVGAGFGPVLPVHPAEKT